MTITVLHKTNNTVNIIRGVPEGTNIDEFLDDHWFCEYDYFIAEPTIKTMNLSLILEETCCGI